LFIFCSNLGSGVGNSPWARKYSSNMAQLNKEKKIQTFQNTFGVPDTPIDIQTYKCTFYHHVHRPGTMYLTENFLCFESTAAHPCKVFQLLPSQIPFILTFRCSRIFNLLPPSSFLLPPSSFLLPPSSFLLPPSSFLLPPSSSSSSFLLPPTSSHLRLTLLDSHRVGERQINQQGRILAWTSP
jgi:hypothetical protein